MTRRTATILVTTLLTAALLVAGLLLPVPYVSLSPGPTANTIGSYGGTDLIRISGRQSYPSSGELALTTVSEHDKLTLFGAIRGWLDSDTAVVPEEVEKPPGTSNEDLQRRFNAEMQESQEAATSAALHHLRIPATVRVDSLTEGAAAAGKLKPGDVIVAVNGKKISDAVDLRSDISKAGAGHPLTISYRRGSAPPSNVQVTPVLSTADGAPRAVIGVLPKEDRPFNVSIELKGVGGPSAGLMFATGIVDELTPGSLTNGRNIAGTGTIAPDGTVGPIGGIQQKLLGARRAGATVFLVPADNCAEARTAIPAGLRLIKVTSLDDALASISKLNSGSSDIPTC